MNSATRFIPVWCQRIMKPHRIGSVLLICCPVEYELIIIYLHNHSTQFRFFPRNSLVVSFLSPQVGNSSPSISSRSRSFAVCGLCFRSVSDFHLSFPTRPRKHTKRVTYQDFRIAPLPNQWKVKNSQFLATPTVPSGANTHRANCVPFYVFQRNTPSFPWNQNQNPSPQKHINACFTFTNRNRTQNVRRHIPGSLAWFHFTVLQFSPPLLLSSFDSETEE